MIDAVRRAMRLRHKVPRSWRCVRCGRAYRMVELDARLNCPRDGAPVTLIP